jgi:bifunctional non-homologous end joining protein LigD
MSEARGRWDPCARIDRRPDARPAGSASAGSAWSFEPKWDGFRALALVGPETRLLSRRRNDLTYLCPGVAVLAGADLGDAVLDGEIVAFRDGIPSFEALQTRMRHRVEMPTAFLAFDVLGLRGVSLIEQPYAV